MDEYLNIYENDFYLLDDPQNKRLKLVGLNQTSFLISVINYYRSVLNYMDQELLHIRAKDFSQRMYSTVSNLNRRKIQIPLRETFFSSESHDPIHSTEHCGRTPFSGVDLYASVQI